MKNIYRNRVERELTVTQERWGETRGTRTELKIRDRLIASDLSIKKNGSIMKFLRENCGNIDSAHVLMCTLGEDGYI